MSGYLVKFHHMNLLELIRGGEQSISKVETQFPTVRYILEAVISRRHPVDKPVLSVKWLKATSAAGLASSNRIMKSAALQRI